MTGVAVNTIMHIRFDLSSLHSQVWRRCAAALLLWTPSKSTASPYSYRSDAWNERTDRPLSIRPRPALAAKELSAEECKTFSLSVDYRSNAVSRAG